MESNSNATSNNSKSTAPAAAAGSNPVSNTNDSQKTNDSSATIPPPTDSNNSEAKKDSASAAKADNTGSSSNGPANPGIGGGSIPTPQSGTANASGYGSVRIEIVKVEIICNAKKRYQLEPSLQVAHDKFWQHGDPICHVA